MAQFAGDEYILYSRGCMIAEPNATEQIKQVLIKVGILIPPSFIIIHYIKVSL